MRFYRPDAWTGTHLLGCYFLTRLISHVPEATLLGAAVIAFLMGIMWEFADEAKLETMKTDARGGDWGDVVADGVGCGLALII